MDSKWKNLPRDVLGVIAECLKSNDFDILHLRAVCSSWRASVAPLEISPFRSSRLDKIASKIADLSESDSSFSPFTLKAMTTFFLSPPENYAVTDSPSGKDTPCWIIQVVETGLKKLSLLTPTLTYPYKPRYFKGVPLPDLNLVNYKVTCISQSYVLECEQLHQRGKLIKDVIIETNNGIIVFVLDFSGDLLFWKHGMKDWVTIITGTIYPVMKYAKMVRHRDRIYVGKYNEELTVIDMVTCVVLQRVSFPICEIGFREFCLGVFKGNLYLITYDSICSWSYFNDLRIYVLDDEDNSTWVRVIKPNFEGGAFLVFHYAMLYVSAKDLGHLPKGDCMYFYDHCYCVMCYDLHARKSFFHERKRNCGIYWPPPHWIKDFEENSVCL